MFVVEYTVEATSYTVVKKLNIHRVRRACYTANNIIPPSLFILTALFQQLSHCICMYSGIIHRSSIQSNHTRSYNTQTVCNYFLVFFSLCRLL